MKLSKEQEEMIKRQIENELSVNGSITTEKIMELIRPHSVFDCNKAREQALRKEAREIIKKHGESK